MRAAIHATRRLVVWLAVVRFELYVTATSKIDSDAFALPIAIAGRFGTGGTAIFVRRRLESFGAAGSGFFEGAARFRGQDFAGGGAKFGFVHALYLGPLRSPTKRRWLISR